MVPSTLSIYLIATFLYIIWYSIVIIYLVGFKLVGASEKYMLVSIYRTPFNGISTVLRVYAVQCFHSSASKSTFCSHVFPETKCNWSLFCSVHLFNLVVIISTTPDVTESVFQGLKWKIPSEKPKKLDTALYSLKKNLPKFLLCYAYYPWQPRFLRVHNIAIVFVTLSHILLNKIVTGKQLVKQDCVYTECFY